MIHEMPGQLKSRKRKTCSEPKGSRKACSSQRRCVRSGQLQSSVDSKPHVDRSEISCECEKWSDQKRCSASPQPQARDDKENQLDPLRPGCCGERMEYEDYSKNMFPDDDSNQILPVEQFFGNMDTVQDFPQRPSAPSTGVQRAQRRRRYYAQEDSEEEEEEEGSHSRTSQDHTEDCTRERH